MSELLDAAKAVIEKWDLIKPEQVPSYIKELHAAVERSEEQESVGFEEWFEPNYKMLAELWTGDCAKTGWNAGVQAERERIKEIIKAVKEDADAHFAWEFCCEELLEKIHDVS